MQVEDYAQTRLEEEGDFRAFPLEWTVEKSTSTDKETGRPSQAVAIAIKFGIASKWHGKPPEGGGWSTTWPIGYFTETRVWVVGKEGALNESAIERLAKCGLWDGDWDKLGGPIPTGFYVLVAVKAETYEGRTRYRGDWVSPDAEEPPSRGGFTPADPTLLANLRSQFQSQTRAVAGGKLSGTAPAPPPTPGAPVAGGAPQQPQPTPAVTPGAPAAQPQTTGGAPAPAPAPSPAPAPAPGGEEKGPVDPGKTPF